MKEHHKTELKKKLIFFFFFKIIIIFFNLSGRAAGIHGTVVNPAYEWKILSDIQQSERFNLRSYWEEVQCH